MPDETLPPDKEELLKAENRFMKMKLMLERGAKFEAVHQDELPPAVENEFLNHIMEYERQADQRRTIRVFDKIGRPDNFPPISEIPEDQIGQTWQKLADRLEEHSIHLNVLSPNIGLAELYRFTVEELFEYEMDDLSIPGMMHMFTYDEFHPDPVFESERVVGEELFPGLFKTAPVGEYFFCLHDGPLMLNGIEYAEAKDVAKAFDLFKSFYSMIELRRLRLDPCRSIDTSTMRISGDYEAAARTASDNKEVMLQGAFLTDVQPDDLGYWSVRSMDIGGVEF